MEDFKKFWTLLKKWYADPIDKHSAIDIVEWIDDYIKNPQPTLEDIETMNKKYEEETK
tara:strand:- start:490 stop:663 length:174 start_codon:yes stop_codon:yes gene_type:complete